MNRFKATSTIAILGVIGNLILFTFKLIVSILFHSSALLADTLHSGTDIFSSCMTWVGNALAKKTKDDKHPFGHGKIEYIFSFIIGIFMSSIGISMLVESIVSIIQKNTIIFSWYMIIICLLTILIKVFLYAISSYFAKKYDSLLILANASDHRNDIFITLSSMIGIIASYYGIFYLDYIIGIFISFWIIYTGSHILWKAYLVLIDTNNLDLKTKVLDILKDESFSCLEYISLQPIGIQYILLISISSNCLLLDKNIPKTLENFKNKTSSIKEISEIYYKIKK